MARLGRSRYLRCFYCGRPSKTRNDGTVSEFLCLNCDATNYLDENGEITDPPVATTTASQPNSQYAIHRSTPPTGTAATPAQEIFCTTCLKNQHLFTSSLAQYLPEDPNHPDYPELERNYYKFRARLEERYPQMCAECEPKVLGKLDEAGYTAKTDFLRRMMERSRMNRATPKRRTFLDVADTLGRWAWWAGFFLQVLWHLSVVDGLFRNDMPLGDTGGWKPRILEAIGLVTRFLPHSPVLVGWALQATLFGAWWNPKFPQVYRGFSRHILGLRQWYTFQALLVAFRLFFPRFAALDAEGAEQMSAQLTIHVFMAAMTTYIGLLARRSVRQDTTPLFGTPSGPTSPPKAPPSQQKEAAAQNLSNVLDEILMTPTPKLRAAGSLEQAGSRSHMQSSPIYTRSDDISTPSRTTHGRSVQYSTEMDWSPTQSPPPAFQNISHKSQPFGQPESRETQPQNPFWAKVPPAPKPPAQRLINPMPPAKESIKQDREIFTARFGSGKLERVAGIPGSSNGAVDFKQPTFFPDARAGSDPTNSLADILSNSFSLSQDNKTTPKRNALVRNPFSPNRGLAESATPSKVRGSRALDSAFLAALLGAWAYAMLFPDEYSLHIMKFALAVAVMLTLRVAKDTFTDVNAATSLSPAAAVGATLCVMELGAVAYVAKKIWAVDKPCQGCGDQGLWILGVMLGHQLWNAWC